MKKIGIYMEREVGKKKGVIDYYIYKDGKAVKLSSLSGEDLSLLSDMVNGISHKLWHMLHYKMFKCCPTCNVKKGKR